MNRPCKGDVIKLDKHEVDKIIPKYLHKIFGFTISKSMNIDEAEELASDIVFEVYTSLLKKDDVENIDGYVYKISQNVYAQHVDKINRNKKIVMNLPYRAVEPISNRQKSENRQKEKKIEKLRREIAFLYNLQREIVVMHYYEKKKIDEIAKQLNLPVGSVKWHLYDARNQIKEGMKMELDEIVGVRPIRFASLSHFGRLGSKGEDTRTYLHKLITQNIAYSAYHEAKTINEIAKELNVATAYVEDEIDILVDYGYMDKIAGNRYQTNILITQTTPEILNEKHEIYTKYAKIACDMYIPLLIRESKKVFNLFNGKDRRVYTPKDDSNFFLWNIITFVCSHKLIHDEKSLLMLNKFLVKRKNGGENIALACGDYRNFEWDKLIFDKDLLDFYGDLTLQKGDDLRAWQLGSRFDIRDESNQYCFVENFADILYEHITRKLTKTPDNVYKYKALYDHDYLISDGVDDYVNIVVSSMKFPEFIEKFPSMPKGLKKFGKQLDEEIYNIDKVLYPKHLQDLCRAANLNSLSSTHIRFYILKQLFEDGVLKSLTENQKKTVNTIMFIEERN